MDATRSRRTRSSARQQWYAAYRSHRFARHFGFPPISPLQRGDGRKAWLRSWDNRRAPLYTAVA